MIDLLGYVGVTFQIISVVFFVFVVGYYVWDLVFCESRRAFMEAVQNANWMQFPEFDVPVPVLVASKKSALYVWWLWSLGRISRVRKSTYIYCDILELGVLREKHQNSREALD